MTRACTRRHREVGLCCPAQLHSDGHISHAIACLSILRWYCLVQGLSLRNGPFHQVSNGQHLPGITDMMSCCTREEEQ